MCDLGYVIITFLRFSFFTGKMEMKIFALFTSKRCCEDEIRDRDNTEKEGGGRKRETVNVLF